MCMHARASVCSVMYIINSNLNMIPLALLVISSYHHLVYQMLSTNLQQNLSIIKEHCTVPPYHEDRITSAATAKESNDRILKFLEEKYSQTCNYDEFFVILRKLIEMPKAMSIIDSFQKSMYIHAQYTHIVTTYVSTIECVNNGTFSTSRFF